MKQFILTSFLLVVCFPLYQQETTPRFLLEGTGLYTDFNNIEYRQGGGASFDIFLGKRVSTHYVAYFGKNYCEISPGVISIPLLLAMASDDDDDTETLEGLGFALFLVAVSFENISLHYKISENISVSPSLSLFRIRYFFDENNAERQTYLSMSGGLGLKINQKLGKYFTIGAFSEAAVLYTKEYPLGFSAGISLGVFIPRK